MTNVVSDMILKDLFTHFLFYGSVISFTILIKTRVGREPAMDNSTEIWYQSKSIKIWEDNKCEMLTHDWMAGTKCLQKLECIVFNNWNTTCDSTSVILEVRRKLFHVIHNVKILILLLFTVYFYYYEWKFSSSAGTSSSGWI